MRLFVYGLGFTLALGTGLALGGGCAATTNPLATSAGVGGSSGTGGASSGTGLGGMGTGAFATSSASGSSGTMILPDGDVPDGLGACAASHAAATQDPAAMLVLLQASSSMNLGSKWPAAQQAIVQAIDQDAFDSMSLGLMTFPLATQVAGPACIFNLPVNCGTSGLPQVPVQPAGMNKSSDPTGVRHDIYQYLSNATPVSETVDPANSTPLYDAMNNAYQALKGINIAKRMLVVVTDGGGSCTSLSQPLRPNYPDGNNCPDWEQPANFNAMISKWQQDPNTPIDTFIVGVPGSDSNGQMVQFYDTAPYSMLLALSTYAVSGSPTTVDPNCDKTAMFTQTGAAPAHPCHIDLSNGNNFNAMALANAISTLRGKALGCVYDIPQPPMGQTFDPTEVNVVITINGTPYEIPKRTSPTDMCASSPCWDYDMNNKIDLIGIACSSVQQSANAKVDIYFGCATFTK